MESSVKLYRNILLLCLILTILPAEIFAQQLNAIQKLSMTIYNNNNALITEKRTLDAQKGSFNIQLDDISSQLNPSSVVIQFPGDVIRQNYQKKHATMLDVLKSYIGHQIRFVNVTGQVRGGTLVALDGDHAIIHSPDEGGYVVISHVWDHVFILDNLRMKPSNTNSITWTLRDSKGGAQPFDLTYQTGGINWSAHYNMILQNNHKADIKGWADIENQTGTDYTGADVTLVAGNTHQANSPQPRLEGVAMKSTASYDVVTKQRSFSDYHIYDLQGEQTISAHSKQMVPLIDGKDIDVKKEYIYQPQYFSPIDRVNNSAVMVRYTMVNTEKNHLGKPLAAGVVSLYKMDNGKLVLLGEDNIDHTAVNDSITVTQGEAFDVKGSDKVTDIRHLSQKVAERDIDVGLSNQKDSGVVVTVIQHLSDRDRIIKSNYSYKKRSAYVYEFRVPVKAHGTSHLTYSVRQTNP